MPSVRAPCRVGWSAEGTPAKADRQWLSAPSRAQPRPKRNRGLERLRHGEVVAIDLRSAAPAMRGASWSMASSSFHAWPGTIGTTNSCSSCTVVLLLVRAGGGRGVTSLLWLGRGRVHGGPAERVVGGGARVLDQSPGPGVVTLGGFASLLDV